MAQCKVVFEVGYRYGYAAIDLVCETPDGKKTLKTLMANIKKKDAEKIAGMLTQASEGYYQKSCDRIYGKKKEA